MQLGDIAQIKTGLVLSRKKAAIEYEVKANYKLLSLKNINDEGIIESDIFDNFSSNENLDDQYFTQEGDILIRLNHPYTAIYIDKSYSGLLVPSSFAIIQIDDRKVLPEYLAWYLNTDNVKNELERSQAGSRIPSTNQHTLKKIPINLAPLSKQKTIIELFQLHQKEKLLYKKLLEEKELYFKGIVQQILGGTTNDWTSDTRQN